MESKKNNNLKWIIVGILLCCFAVVAFFMVTERINVFDDFVYGIISECINPVMTNIVLVITNFASPITIVVISLFVSYILGIKKKDKKTAILFCLNIVIIALLNYLLKNIFTRIRPEDINIITESGYSFPSGHSATGLAFYGYIIYLINERCNNKKIKLISTISLSIVILLIGLSRIYLGVHYASDVTAAFMLSLSYLIIYTHITKRSLDNKI